ncbi:MAG: glycosyltransferase [Pseudomonadota bacterium]
MPTAAPNLVSVIIPCYNGERFLREAIDSALAQTYSPVEIIVVDDGSTDGSAAIMASFGDRIRVVRQPNAGLPEARNVGIRSSQGAMLAFLDADDYWERDFLARMVEALDRTGAGIAYCGWQNVGLPGPRGQPFVPPDYEADPAKLEKLVGGVRWPVHAAVVRREVVDSVGGFDPALESCEDFAFWIRAATVWPLALVPETLAYYRHHGNQMTSKRLMIVRNHFRVQRQFLRERPEVARKLGRRRVRALTYGELLRKGYELYWQRDLASARKVFRMVMRAGYGGLGDWKYMLPALLPRSWHRALIGFVERHGKAASS